MLGRGGMGLVYEATDDELGRPLAIKVVRASDPESADRLRREARAAAATTHPAICQVYEIGEHDGALFIAMERLGGESLASRLARGPLAVRDAAEVGLGLLAGLSALHDLGRVHRDIKPSNVYLTPHGVKLLDFGVVTDVARPADETFARLTISGALVGTPAYMSPEQITGAPVDGRSDLFAAGVVLYECLSGERPFCGATLLEILRAVTEQSPPALAGGPGVAAVDLVIQRALAKRPGDRHATAADMAAALLAAVSMADAGASVLARRMRRVIVLPFRLLRPDPEIDFLSFALADAIATSLVGLDGLTVRSSAVALRYEGAAPDLAAIARETDVDHVVTGTILRAGSQLRVNTQLVEAHTGTLAWSLTSQVGVSDLFQLQDDLTSRISESLAIPLAPGGGAARHRDVPATPSAYEYYLRANLAGARRSGWVEARDLYRQCLREDPAFAPAWARLGRAIRFIGKYTDADPRPTYEEAEHAFRRAIALNPDLSMAHTYLAALEDELGRAPDAMRRLLARAREHPSDPELFAGLVHACRYCGLLEASVAAHERAVRLDPASRTSVSFTFLARGEWARALAQADNDIHTEVIALAMLGRERDAVVAARDRLPRESFPLFRIYGESLIALLEGRPNDAAGKMRGTEAQAAGFMDPEGFFIWARVWARLGRKAEAMRLLERAGTGGFDCLQSYRNDPWLASLQDEAAFAALVDRVAARRREAVESFTAAQGDVVLGVRESF